MPLKTRAQIRLSSRRRADLTAEAGAISDDEWNDYIDQVYHELYDLMIDADTGRTFSKNAGIPIQKGVYSYKLPNDFYRCIGVHVKGPGTAAYQKAIPADPSEYPEMTANSSNYYYYNRPKYYIRWDVKTGERHLFIFPKEVSGVEIAIVYFPLPPTFEDDEDTVDNPASWLEFVDVGVAIKALDKLERDTAPLLVHWKRLGQRIEDAINDLDQSGPSQIRDIERHYSRSRGYYY